MKSCVCLLLLCCLTFGHPAWSQPPARRYPNELAKYPFYASDPWRQIVPLISTMADVRRILGDPVEAIDIAEYGKPYPGDKRAKQPLFTYRRDTRWQVLIYFVGTGLVESRYEYPAELRGRVLSVDFLSVDPLPFRRNKLSKTFKKHSVLAADALWDEFADGTGLKYEIYTSYTPYGRTKPGDLDRISYGASQAEMARVPVKVGR